MGQRNTAESGGRNSASHYGCRLRDGSDPFDGLVSPAEVDHETPMDRILKDPNKRLMLAVLQQARDDLFSPDDDTRHEAYCWFQGDDARSPQEVGREEIGGYNFTFIANELGFGSRIGAAREALAAAVRTGVKNPTERKKTCRACKCERLETDFHLVGCNSTRRAICRDCFASYKKTLAAARVVKSALAAVQVEAA